MKIPNFTDDPNLKFAVGVMKGQPLSASGFRYRIVKRNGIEVAQFANGTMAHFYRAEPEPSKIVSPGDPEYTDLAAGLNPDGIGGWKPEVLNPKPEVPEAPEPPVSLEPAKRIAVYKTRAGERPKHPSDPLYCVLEGGTVVENFDRQVVGFGLREYLWLYERFRLFGRGWFAAAWEAMGVYFL